MCLPLTALLACSGADPPFEELPLRDALTADPEVIASLSSEARKDLAERFEQARRAQRDVETVDAEPGAAPALVLGALDRVREARGDDALVAASVAHGSGPLAVQPLSISPARRGSAGLPPMAGLAEAPTAELEQRALHGEAGELVTELVRASHAERLVRVTAWPVGAAAVGDTVYVNASWLVALSGEAGDGGASAPVIMPLSLGGNPYLTYGSLASCVKDVSQRCATCLKTGPCDAKATLQDFADGKSECAFLAKDMNRPAQLCALALLSIGSVGECVRAANAACSLPGVENLSSNLPEASTFIADMACVQALDQCLSGSPQGSSDLSVDFHVQDPGCEDPFSACASAFKGLGDSCKTGSCTGVDNQSCTSCSSCKSTGGQSCNDGCGGSSGGSGSSSSSCDSCKSGTGGSSSGSSSSACKCQTRAPSPAPLGTLAWLLAPLGYALLRARRPT